MTSLRRLSSWLLSRFSRETSSGRLVLEIDGLRVAAIMAVVLYHSHAHFFRTDGGSEGAPWDALSALIQLGWFGVQLFLVISGFIVAIPFADAHLSGRRPAPLGTYYLRRLARLHPPYLINLTIFLLFFCDRGELLSLLPHYLASAFYAHGLVYQDYSPVNNVTWALEIIIQFYLVAPFLCVVYAVRPTWLRRGILVLGMVASAAQMQYLYHPWLGWTIVNQMRWFLGGLLLADVYLVTWKSAPPRGLAWDLLGAAAWALVPFLLLTPIRVAGVRADLHILPFALVAACAGAFRGRVLSRLFSAGWIVGVGGITYSIFLYHVPYIWRLKRLLGEVPIGSQPAAFAMMLVDAIGIVLVCAIYFVLFEKPFMRKDWPARAWSFVRRKASAPSASPASPSLDAPAIAPPASSASSPPRPAPPSS